MAADVAWKDRGHISRTTLCVLAFSGVTLPKLPDTLKAPPNRKDADWDGLVRPDKRISTAIADFTYYLRRQNHGIKEENLISMMLRIGVDPGDLDELLVADLNDLGVRRGEVAHGGASGSVSKGVNPRDEFEQIRRICEELKQLDSKLTAVHKTAR